MCKSVRALTVILFLFCAYKYFCLIYLQAVMSESWKACGSDVNNLSLSERVKVSFSLIFTNPHYDFL